MFKLLCLLANPEPDADAIRAHIAAHPVNWAQLTTLAERHKVAPLIHYALTISGVSSDRYPSLTTLARTHAVHSLACVQALTAIRTAFAAAQFSFIPIKGAVLAALYYGDVGRRAFLDVDMLVIPAFAEKARTMLETLGYRVDPFLAQADTPADYHLHLTHPGTGVAVELHWALTFARFGAQADDGLLWETAAWRPLFGGELLVPGDEAMLVYLCAHGWRHGWSRLSWVCDVAALIASGPALRWDQVEHFARLTNTRRVVALGLRLAVDLLDTSVPSQTFARWMHDPVVGKAADQIRGWLQADEPPSDAALQRFYFTLRDGWRDKLAYAPFAARRLLTPNTRDRAFVRLPHRLRGLYWFVRPIRLLVERLLYNS